MAWILLIFSLIIYWCYIPIFHTRSFQKNCSSFVSFFQVLGGSSALNGLLYVRGLKRDYDTWAAAGNEGWSYEALLPYFRSCEDAPYDEEHRWIFLGGFMSHDGSRWCPSLLAKLVNITPITMVYGRYFGWICFGGEGHSSIMFYRC